eukprot:1374583-Pyramimonas_sp.AAC.1
MYGTCVSMRVHMRPHRVGTCTLMSDKAGSQSSFEARKQKFCERSQTPTGPMYFGARHTVHFQRNGENHTNTTSDTERQRAHEQRAWSDTCEPGRGVLASSAYGSASGAEGARRQYLATRGRFHTSYPAALSTVRSTSRIWEQIVSRVGDVRVFETHG